MTTTFRINYLKHENDVPYIVERNKLDNNNQNPPTKFFLLLLSEYMTTIRNVD